MIKVPPTMGARARGKLNKDGRLRQPANLKGLTMPAMGGLAAAARSNGKMRKPVGFAEGGLAEKPYSEILARTRKPGSEYSQFDDPELLGELARRRSQFHSQVAARMAEEKERVAQSTPGYLENLIATGNEMRGRGNPLEKYQNMASAPSQISIGSGALGMAAPATAVGALGTANQKGQSHASVPATSAATAMSSDDAVAALRAAVMRAQARRAQPQGNVNVPLLMASAALVRPTRTGSFFEALGNAATAGGEALMTQRQREEEAARSGEDMHIRLLEQELARQDAERKRLADEAYRYASLENQLKAANIRTGTGEGGEKSTAFMRDVEYMVSNGIPRERALEIRSGIEGARVRAQLSAARADASTTLIDENGNEIRLTKSQLDDLISKNLVPKAGQNSSQPAQKPLEDPLNIRG